MRPADSSLPMPVLQCLRCKHRWYPRRPELPPRCPKCGSPYWNKPKRLA